MSGELGQAHVDLKQRAMCIECADNIQLRCSKSFPGLVHPGKIREAFRGSLRRTNVNNNADPSEAFVAEIQEVVEAKIQDTDGIVSENLMSTAIGDHLLIRIKNTLDENAKSAKIIYRQASQKQRTRLAGEGRAHYEADAEIEYRRIVAENHVNEEVKLCLAKLDTLRSSLRESISAAIHAAVLTDDCPIYLAANIEDVSDEAVTTAYEEPLNQFTLEALNRARSGIRRRAAVDATMPMIIPQGLAGAGLIAHGCTGKLNAATAAIGGTSILASIYSTGTFAARKADYVFSRKILRHEAKDRLLDVSSSEGRARKILGKHYGTLWIQLFEKWATQPNAIPLANAFRVAHRARADFNRALLIQKPVEKVQTIDLGDTPIAKSCKIEARKEANRQMKSLYDIEESRIMLYLSHEDPASDEFRPLQSVGVRCLSALQSEEIDVNTATYATYLQSNRRAITESDIQRRAKELLTEQFE